MTHDVASEACWCRPSVLQACPACADDPPSLRAQAGCWRCGARVVVPPYDDALPLIVVHNDTDDILRELTRAD